MPQNDLATFKVLSFDGDIEHSGKGKKAAGAPSWAAAVQLLWLTPLPRIIVVDSGGQSFGVYGGGDLKVVPRGVASDQRREIFCSNNDPHAPSIDIGMGSWWPADSLIQSPPLGGGKKMERFECLLLSGRVDYNRGVPNGSFFYVEPSLKNGSDHLENKHRMMVHVVTDSSENTATGLNMEKNQPANASGWVRVDLENPDNGGMVQKDVTLYRMTGRNRIAQGNNGHHHYLYGYMIQMASQHAGNVEWKVVGWIFSLSCHPRPDTFSQPSSIVRQQYPVPGMLPRQQAIGWV